MPTINETAELSWLQLFPKGSDESSITKEEFQVTALNEAAYLLWAAMMRERSEEGSLEVPSYLLKETEVKVVDGVADISNLSILKGIPREQWLQNIGGLSCDCDYVKSTMNLSQLLKSEDERGHNYKTYFVVGNSIRFPQGVHKNPLSIIYATNGEGMDEDFEVSGEIAAQVRARLLEIYGNRIAKEDVTNNTNPN